MIGAREAKKLAALSDDIASGDLDSAVSRLGGQGDSAGAKRRASESMEPDKKLAGSAYDDVRQALDDTDEIEFSFKGLNKLFGTLQSRVFYSESSIVRKISSKMLDSGLVKNKGVRGRSAEGTASLLRKTFEAGVFRESLPMFRQWAKKNGIGNIKRNIGADDPLVAGGTVAEFVLPIILAAADAPGEFARGRTRRRGHAIRPR